MDLDLRLDANSVTRRGFVEHADEWLTRAAESGAVEVTSDNDELAAVVLSASAYTELCLAARLDRVKADFEAGRLVDSATAAARARAVIDRHRKA